MSPCHVVRNWVEAYRCASRWTLGILALILSLIIVTTNIPRRMEGSRTGTEAFIPFRSPSPLELAVILEWSRAKTEQRQHHTVSISDYLKAPRQEGCLHCISLVDATSDSLWFATKFYVLPRIDPTRDPAERSSASMVNYKGSYYDVVSASWENYLLLHRVARKDLEEELNMHMAPEYIHKELKENLQYSFRSDRLWQYFLTEVTYLSCLLFLILNRLRRPCNIFIRIPCLLLLVWLNATFTINYSPAYLDADLFHQRIVLEDLLDPAFYVVPYLWIPSLISLAALILIGLRKLLLRFFSVPRKEYWIVGNYSGRIFKRVVLT